MDRLRLDCHTMNHRMGVWRSLLVKVCTCKHSAMAWMRLWKSIDSWWWIWKNGIWGHRQIHCCLFSIKLIGISRCCAFCWSWSVEFGHRGCTAVWFWIFCRGIPCMAIKVFVKQFKCEYWEIFKLFYSIEETIFELLKRVFEPLKRFLRYSKKF